MLYKSLRLLVLNIALVAVVIAIGHLVSYFFG